MSAVGSRQIFCDRTNDDRNVSCCQLTLHTKHFFKTQVYNDGSYKTSVLFSSSIHVCTSVSYHTFLTGSVFLTLSFLLAALFISVTFSSSLTPAVKVEKMHLRVDSSSKLAQISSAPATTSSSSTSSSSTTVSSNTTTITTSSSSSALKPGLNCPSIPKPPLLAPGQIPNGKGHLSVLSDKKQDGASSRRHISKKVTGELYVTNVFFYF